MCPYMCTSETKVIGMLEVIEGDFQRTISETEKAEKQAAQDHTAFMTETGKSLAEKEQAIRDFKDNVFTFLQLMLRFFEKCMV